MGAGKGRGSYELTDPEQIFKWAFKGVAFVRVNKLLHVITSYSRLRLGVQPTADSPDYS